MYTYYMSNQNSGEREPSINNAIMEIIYHEIYMKKHSKYMEK